MTEPSNTERSVTVSVPGGSLFVLDAGAPADPPIVLIHAGIADLRSWDELVPLLAERGHRVIRYDTRPLGRSTTEDVPFSDRADVLAVMDALGVGQATLVGNSRGGRIAMDTAIEFPERIVAVIGLGAGIGGFEGELTDLEKALEDEMIALDAADPIDPEAIVDLHLRLWVDGPGQPPTRVPEALREKVRAMDAFEADRVEGRPIPLEPPAIERLGELRCPVLAVVGSLDLQETAQAAHLLAAEAPDATAVVIPDVAHMIAMEAPGLVAGLVVDFLAPMPRWS